MRVIRLWKCTHELFASFLKNTEVHEGCENKSKKTTTGLISIVAETQVIKATKYTQIGEHVH